MSWWEDVAADETMLVLVRHGDAHAGFHGVIGGERGCAGLTELGRQQAHLLGSRLVSNADERPDVMISSVIPRAIETARIVADAVGVDDVPSHCDLCEVHTGEADGVPWADYDERFGSFLMTEEVDRPFAPGGDSWTSFHDRVEAMMQRVVSEYRGQSVMAFCHAGVIAASLRVRFGNRAESVRLTPTNTGLTAWRHGESGWKLLVYDDAMHLRPPVQER